MKLNPFEEQLASAEARVLELSDKLKVISGEIDWYESVNLHTLMDNCEELENKIAVQSQEYSRLRVEAQNKTAEIDALSKSIKSNWNPFNWFDTEQQLLKYSINLKKSTLGLMEIAIGEMLHQIEDLERQVEAKTAEI